VVSVVSARPDGATSIAMGLAAVRSRTARVLLIDLCPHGPEVAPLLDVEDSPNVYELSFVARLSPVSASDLEASVQWRDGLGVLAGARPQPGPRGEISDAFVDGLVSAAAATFDLVILDLGRPRAQLPPTLTGGSLLWVVTPSPLGMAALDRAVSDLVQQEATWLPSARVVLNRVGERSWQDVEPFIHMEYGMRVAGTLPLADECWRTLEDRHSLAPFCVPVIDRKRHQRAYGADAWRVRQALEALARAITPERKAQAVAPAEEVRA
jgi:Flp pilus assembly CpaE family ATPase